MRNLVQKLEFSTRVTNGQTGGLESETRPISEDNIKSLLIHQEDIIRQFHRQILRQEEIISQQERQIKKLSETKKGESQEISENFTEI